MQLGEVYKAKNDGEKIFFYDKILISRFATRWFKDENGKIKHKMIIVADTFMDGEMIYTSPSFSMWFETEADILKDYELFMTQEQYSEYVNNYESYAVKE